MRDPIAVTLAGTRYDVRPLNISQTQRLMARIGKMSGAEFAIEALKIALERSEPKILKPDEFEAPTPELFAAASAVLEASGFVRGPDAGEAEAPGSTGATS